MLIGVVRNATTFALTLLLALAAAAPAAAGCVASLVQAATRHGVPPDLMLAIGHAESGWKAFAVNSAGTSHFPQTAAEAVALVLREQARGVDSIDVGCGQINLRWHADAFDDLSDAFDPEHNAEYAARFLAELNAVHGDWTTAVARYHSSDPEAQQAYLSRVHQRLTVLQDGAPPDYFRSNLGPADPPPAAEGDADMASTRTVRPRIVDITPGRNGDAEGRVIRLPGLR